MGAAAIVAPASLGLRETVAISAKQFGKVRRRPAHGSQTWMFFNGKSTTSDGNVTSTTVQSTVVLLVVLRENQRWTQQNAYPPFDYKPYVVLVATFPRSSIAEGFAADRPQHQHL